jgi:hypothetical protein
MTKEQKIEALKLFTHGSIGIDELWKIFFDHGCHLVIWTEEPIGVYRSNTGLIRSMAEVCRIRVHGQCNVLIHSQETAEKESKRRGLPMMVNNWTCADLEQN